MMIDDDRSAVICVGGVEYTLVLTVKATKAIAKKYGGLGNLGEKLLKSENFDLALDEVIWLVVLLANQSILIHNLQNPKDKKEPLTEEVMELLTTPADLAGYKDSIISAMSKGMARNIVSSGDGGEPPEEPE